MKTHRFLSFTYENDAARYCHIFNYEDDWELSEGMEIGEDYPADVEFRMDKDFPDYIGRNDFLHTIGQYMVVQPRVREFLEQKGIPNLQFLDVVVKDHKGRPVPETYWVVNFTEHVDCIDKEATRFEWNSLNEEQMDKVSNLTLLPAALEGVQLARAKHLPRLLIIAQSLADEMTAAGFTGFEAKALSEFKP